MMGDMVCVSREREREGRESEREREREREREIDDFEARHDKAELLQVI
jgi:hypothetical protein